MFNLKGKGASENRVVLGRFREFMQGSGLKYGGSMAAVATLP